jgi:hypothetical protein
MDKSLQNKGLLIHDSPKQFLTDQVGSPNLGAKLGVERAELGAKFPCRLPLLT